MTQAQKMEFGWHRLAWKLSQFLHGEQGALLVASQLRQLRADVRRQAVRGVADVRRSAPRRGVRPLSAPTSVGIMYPVNAHLKALLDKILTDERWDLKFIGMQLIIESLALAAFHMQKVTPPIRCSRNARDSSCATKRGTSTFGVNVHGAVREDAHAGADRGSRAVRVRGLPW